MAFPIGLLLSSACRVAAVEGLPYPLCVHPITRRWFVLIRFYGVESFPIKYSSPITPVTGSIFVTSLNSNKYHPHFNTINWWIFSVLYAVATLENGFKFPATQFLMPEKEEEEQKSWREGQGRKANLLQEADKLPSLLLGGLKAIPGIHVPPPVIIFC